MRKEFFLKSKNFANVILKTAEEKDCENLRQWKNAHRSLFFFQDIISSDQQQKWFQEYLERQNDYMFMVVYKFIPIGCMGFRLINGEADIYNVILGRPAMGGKGLMSHALRLMCSYIHSEWTPQIALKVLKTNPAVKWYKMNHFEESASQPGFLQLRLNIKNFKFCEWEKTNGNLSNTPKIGRPS